jgi:hypothetical protein
MATRSPKKPRAATVCLCMMVKNEARVIRRALDSALPHVDRWAISDTGSIDGTTGEIATLTTQVPGILHSDLWTDFGTNRTTALRHAQEQGCDYILVMDADQTLVVSDPDWKRRLGKDGYNIQIAHGTLTYPHPWLLKASKPWYWIGATHEYLHCDEPYAYESFGGIRLVEHSDSHRRLTGAKLREDAALLVAAHEAHPEDARTVFYLAQVHDDTGDRQAALALYKERVAMGGWVEEVWCAQYRIARIHERLLDWPAALDAYLAAYSLDAQRAESLYRIGRGELAHQRFASAYHFFDAAAHIAKPACRLFLEDAVYDYAARWGKSMALRLLGWHERATREEEAVLATSGVPEPVRVSIVASREQRAIGSLPI